VLPNVVEKTKQHMSYKFWQIMFLLLQVLVFGCPKGGHDVFALVMGILEKKWVPKHITISLFEVSKTSGQTLTRNLQDLLEYYGLTKNSLLI